MRGDPVREFRLRLLEELAEANVGSYALPEERRAAMLSVLDRALDRLGKDSIEVMQDAVVRSLRSRSRHWGRPVHGREHSQVRLVTEFVTALFGQDLDDFRRGVAAAAIVDLWPPSSRVGRAARRWLALNSAEKERRTRLVSGEEPGPLTTIQVPDEGLCQKAAIRRDVEANAPYLVNWRRKKKSAK